ncbi:MAG: DUF488 family protein [Capsulimonadaceae bacterium]
MDRTTNSLETTGEQRILFTIGHSTHSSERFLDLLAAHGVTALYDVRSHPHSRYNPQFNQGPLEAAITRAGLRYRFVGCELGARSEDPDCYEAGKVSYRKLSHTDSFHDGIRQLMANLGTDRIALMCAEKDPIMCHRCILVCRALRDAGISIAHILDTGQLESHRDTESRLLAATGIGEPSLFATAEELLEEAYDIQAARIAYVQPVAA